VKKLLNFGCIDGSQSLNRSWNLKFENISHLGPDPGSKILEQDRKWESENVTMASSALQKGPQFKIA